MTTPGLPAIPFHGTQSASGNVNVVGHASSELKFVVNGDLLPGGDFAATDYKLGPDTGRLVFVRGFAPGGDARQLPGSMTGAFSLGDQKGSVRILIGLREGSEFMGEAVIGEDSLKFTGAVGTPPDPVRRAPIRAAGVAPGVSYFLDGILIGGSVEAKVTALYADGTMLTGEVQLKPSQQPPPPTD